MEVLWAEEVTASLAATAAGYSALVVQAGTMSTRGRGEVNTFNVLRLQRPAVTVERHSWDTDQARFVIHAAWPAKYAVGALNGNGDGNEILIETLELVNEGIERVA